MKRTKRNFHDERLGDIIIKSQDVNYTIIPNSILRNPELSAKAKTILFIILGNKSGWKSNASVIESFNADGRDAILSGLKELERLGYLLRLQTYSTKHKRLAGQLWVITTEANQFMAMGTIKGKLAKKHLQLVNAAGNGFSGAWKPVTNNTNTNNTNRFKKINKKVSLPFKSKSFKDKWDEWKEYKLGEFKFRYRTSISEQGALTRLKNLANKDEDAAIDIIDQAISSGWKGFFAINENGVPKPILVRRDRTPEQQIKYRLKQAGKNQDRDLITCSVAILNLDKAHIVDPFILAERLADLYYWIENNQTKKALKNFETPVGGIGVIEDYIFYLDKEAGWVKEVTEKSFYPTSGLFNNYLNEKSKEFEINIITGNDR